MIYIFNRGIQTSVTEICEPSAGQGKNKLLRLMNLQSPIERVRGSEA